MYFSWMVGLWVIRTGDDKTPKTRPHRGPGARPTTPEGGEGARAVSSLALVILRYLSVLGLGRMVDNE